MRLHTPRRHHYELFMCSPGCWPRSWGRHVCCLSHLIDMGWPLITQKPFRSGLSEPGKTDSNTSSATYLRCEYGQILPAQQAGNISVYLQGDKQTKWNPSSPPSCAKHTENLQLRSALSHFEMITFMMWKYCQTTRTYCIAQGTILKVL